jgi:hypothetical protein
MLIFHTCASRADVELARGRAPSHTHGYGWLPEKMCRHPGPWFLDNGAYAAAKADGEHWEPEPFLARLSQIGDMPRPPRFVTLPDYPGAHDLSVERSAKWLRDVRAFDAPMYLPVQDGATARWEVDRAERWGCDGLFLGGSDGHKRAIAPELVERAHAAGLEVHVGKPGSLRWARDVGVDSVDTSSIVRNDAWGRLDALESDETRQATLV